MVLTSLNLGQGKVDLSDPHFLDWLEVGGLSSYLVDLLGEPSRTTDINTWSSVWPMGSLERVITKGWE